MKVKKSEVKSVSGNVKNDSYEQSGRFDLLGSLFGKTRRLILALLYSKADASFHLRKVIKLTRGQPGSVQRELKKLSDAGLILRTVKDNQVLFQANQKCPIFPEVKSMIMKTAGMADVLREALAPLRQSIIAAAIFGSIARGGENKESDVDIVIVGEVDFVAVIEKLSPAQTLLNREINPVVMSADEFKKRIREKEHFVSAVLGKPLIPIIGDINELAGLA
jgi:predicted nucleotidyltransferase